MAVEGKIGEEGYPEFDSADFENEELDGELTAEEKPAPKEKAAQGSEAKTVEAGEEPAATSEDGGAGGDGASETATAASGGSGDTKTAGAESTATYTPNFKYQVHGQEKEFPKWAQDLVKDKGTEDSVRDLITKGEGLDALKPRFQQAVQERETARSESEGWKTKVNNLLKLRDTNHRLFFAELGVSDEMLIRAGRELLEAKTDAEGNANPQRWSEYERMRQSELAAFNAQQTAAAATQGLQQTQLTAHERSMDVALARPDVAAFTQRFDAIHGQGAFRNAVNAHGSHVFVTTRGYVDPMSAVEHVYQFHSKGMAPVAAAAPAASGAAPVATRPAHVRPAAMPNMGRGKNASPIGAKPKSIKQMRENNKRELARESRG